ncbi:hypothetical protein FRC10_007800 [Ceratobasidium sp. 414]|nr:hypothetical protein FRC10_007800 [Ceratobasidium sp. 414]
MLVCHDDLDSKDLDFLQLEVLEKLLVMGEQSSANSPTKSPAKTPAKSAASALLRIQLLGSPLDALHAAKNQANIVNSAPAASRCKWQDSSSDLDDLDKVLKQPHLDKDTSKEASSGVKAFRSSKPPSVASSHQTLHFPSTQSKQGCSTSLQSMLHAGSVALSMISVGSASMHTAPSRHVSAGGLPDIDKEMVELSEDDKVQVVHKKARCAAMEEAGPVHPNHAKMVYCKDVMQE